MRFRRSGANDGRWSIAKKSESQWADYEALAHKILQELMPYANVKLDEHVFGAESEIKRQIDVTARWTEGDEEYLMIVQVKDYKRKADVNVIGAFISVISDVGASKGVLICSDRFSKAAITYARNRGIQLYSLLDAESKNWFNELTIPIIWHRMRAAMEFSAEFYSDAGWHIDLEDGRMPALAHDQGRRRIDLPAQFVGDWNEGRLDMTVGARHNYPIEEDIFMRIFDREENEMWRPAKLNVTYAVGRESWLGQLVPVVYRGLIDHLDEKNFIPSRLGVHVPRQKEDSWTPVNDPDRVAVAIKGYFLTAEQVEINSNEADWRPVQFKYIGPGDAT